MRFGSRKVLQGKVFDKNAAAYFKFAKIKNPTERDVVNRLIVRMKSSGLWSLFDRLYLMSPTSEFAALTCCKSLTQMSKSGTVTFSSKGLKPTGGSAYLNTNFSISTSSPKVSSNADNTIGVWVPTTLPGTLVDFNSYNFMGTAVASLRSVCAILGDLSEFYFVTVGQHPVSAAISPVQSGLIFSGHITSAISGDSFRGIYKNGAVLTENTSSRAVLAGNFPNHYIGATNNSGTPDYGASSVAPTYSAAYIGKQLTSTQIGVWHSLLTEYQKVFGRL